MSQCNNPDCSSVTDLVFAEPFGSVNLGETHTLSLAWDGTRFFTFGFDENTVKFDAAAAPVAGPSKFSFKGIGTRVSGIGGPNEGAHIKATFDNVRVNGAPYDDFSSALIDRTKWRFLEFVKRVENGVFKSQLTRFGANGSNTLNFADTAGVNAYQADVTVTEVNLSSATARARLSAFFLNDGTPGDGDVGEVHAEIAIFDSGSGLRVWYLVVQCNNPDCSSFTFLIFDDTTFGTVNLGETHTLSLAWDGKRFFTFGFDGNTVKFDAAAAPVVGPSKSSFKGIGTSVREIGGPNEGAHIKATFDNVMLISKTPSMPWLMLLLD